MSLYELAVNSGMSMEEFKWELVRNIAAIGIREMAAKAKSTTPTAPINEITWGLDLDGERIEVSVGIDLTAGMEAADDGEEKN